MAVKLLPQRDHRQVNALKGRQQGFSRGTAGGTFGIARIHSWQRFLGVSQTLTSAELQPRLVPAQLPCG